MKTRIKTLAFAFAVSAFCLLQSASASETPPGFADLVEKLTPAVVNISTTQKIKGGMGMPGIQMFDMPGGEVPEEFRPFFEQFGLQNKQVEREVYSLGSGFIIDESGYIATNNHVIADAEEITVTLSDDSKFKAKIIGRDPKTDLALLKIDAGHKLPAALLGDSDAARVGDWVIAIGNPFGLGGTVTAGIISARARNINAGPFDDFLQTDAAINRGNSGGPMFNVKGEVIGINTAIFSPSGGSIGIGFALPSSMAKTVFAQLRANGHIERGWLGVKIQQVTDEIAESVGLPKTHGALVEAVAKDSPSAKAGIVPGDIITRFDGKEIKEMRNLPRIVAETAIGKTVPVELWRHGTVKTLNIKIGEMKEESDKTDGEYGEDPSGKRSEKSGKQPTALGLSLAPLSDVLRERLGIGADTKGVLVTHVTPGSEASKRNLERGDVILQVGETPVGSPKDVADAITAARKAGRKYVMMHIQRGNEESIFATLPIEEKQ